MVEGPIFRYRSLVSSGALWDDPAQRAAIEKLQVLHSRLRDYDPERNQRFATGWLGFGRRAAEADASLKGLYMYGGVGRGKSMLMDLFFEDAPPERKRRAHFHAFMQEVHAGIHEARGDKVKDPVAPVAARIANEAVLLCFDEMQVSDITDAMILGRLFEALFEQGVVVVTTSNRPPEDLYKDGLNRDLFLPFIEMLHGKLDLHHLESATDYRQNKDEGSPVYFSPLGADSTRAMDTVWEQETEGEPIAPVNLSIHGRRVRLPRSAEHAARASFEELCSAALGPADYLAIAERFEVLFIDDIPTLNRARNNEAKRFVTLIDALYEAKSKLVCSAAAEPEALYVDGEGSFEFARTASRLREMQGKDWGA